MLEKGFEYMCEVYTSYFKNYWYLLLIGLVILALLTVYRSKVSKSMLWICGIIWLLFLNPVVIYLVCSLKGAVTGRYVRIFWLFPFIIGIAYVGTRILEGRKIYQRILILVLAAFILNMTGGTILSSKYFAEAPNLYKVPAEVVEVADKLEEYKREEWPHVCVMANIYLSIYLRQYDGDLIQLYGREALDANGGELYAPLYEMASQEIPYDQLYELGQKAVGKGVNMIVLAKYQVQSQALEAVGFERVDETENYYIFRYKSWTGI